MPVTLDNGPRYIFHTLLRLCEHSCYPFPCVHNVDEWQLSAWRIDGIDLVGAVAHGVWTSLRVEFLHEGARYVEKNGCILQCRL